MGSLACGAGIQSISGSTDKLVIGGLNSLFLGNVRRFGQYEEKCSLCGECIIEFTGGLCPMTLCSKQLLNGPCGGAEKGICEVDKEVKCGWQLIIDRLVSLEQMENYGKLKPYKGWDTSRDGGPRRIIREDMV